MYQTKIILIVFVIFIFPSTSNFAQYTRQQFEITPFAGYLFTSNLQTFDGELKIENNFNYGLALDIRTNDNLSIELLYNRTDTEVRFKQDYFDTLKINFKLSIAYFQVGAHTETATGQFRPFAAFTLGATYFNPAEYGINSNWEFSVTAGGGIKYYFTDNIGIRLQWRFLIPIYFTSTSIFCNNGYCQIFVSGGTYLLQYDLTAGMAVSF